MCLLTHPDTRQAELPQMAARPAVHAVPVAHARGARVARLTPQLLLRGDPFGPADWTLEPEGRGTRLFLVYEGFDPDDPAQVRAGEAPAEL